VDRANARAERAEAEVERFTAHGLLDCHAICDQRDAATAERDQLRAENIALRAAQKACEACDEPTAFEVRQLRARAEKAEAELGKLQELHGCSQEMVVHWCENAAKRSLGLEKCRAELKAYRDAVDAQPRATDEPIRVLLDRITAELAAERARLERITTALADAISTYFGADKLVTAERIEAWQAALKEDAK
jgi:hypothetical protein